MEDTHHVQGWVGWGVAKTLDQVIMYVTEAREYFDQCQDLHRLLSHIKPLVLQSIDQSNAATRAKVPVSVGAAMWLRDLKPALEAAEEQLKKTLVWLAKKKRLGLPLDVFAKHKCSRAIRKITERIRKLAENQGPFANLETTFYTRRIVDKIHEEMTDLSLLVRSNLKIHSNQLLEIKMELAEAKLTKLVHTELSKLGGGKESAVEEIKQVLEDAIKNEMKKITEWQQKAILNGRKQSIVTQREDMLNSRGEDFTSRFESIVSNLNEHAAVREQHRVDKITNSISGLLTAPNSTILENPGRVFPSERLSPRPLISYSLHALQLATNNFAVENEVGRGGTSIVYSGILSDGKKIAVKKYIYNRSKRFLEYFLSEVEVQGLCDHPNILKLYGYYRERESSAMQNLALKFKGKKKNDSSYALVLEYMEHDNLAHYLFENKQGLDWPTRFNIALGVARGLIYLHNEAPQCIVHCDIKARNILLDANFCPKIADFGISKLLKDVEGTIEVGGTVGYLDPEFVATGHLSMMADVFSFGTLLLEIFSGEKCFSMGRRDLFLAKRPKRLYEKGGLQKVVDKMLDPRIARDAYPASELARVIQVSLLCLHKESKNRPTMREALAMLLGESEVRPILASSSLRSSSETCYSDENRSSMAYTCQKDCLTSMQSVSFSISESSSIILDHEDCSSPSVSYGTCQSDWSTFTI